MVHFFKKFLIVFLGSFFVFILGVDAASPASRESTIPAQIFFMNNSLKDRITIYWVDFTGKEVQYNTLSPQSSYLQQTYVGHNWVILRSSDNVANRYIQVNNTYEYVDVAIVDQNPTIKFTVSNYSQNQPSIDVLWNDNGKEIFYKTLSYGESFTVDSYLGHVWLLRDTYSRTLLDTLVVRSDLRQYTYRVNSPIVAPSLIQSSANFSWSLNANPAWSYADVNNYSMRDVCSFRSGNYSRRNFYLLVSENPITYETIQGFRKVGSRILFQRNLMQRNSSWILDCNNGTIRQRY